MSYIRDKKLLKTGVQESQPWSEKIDLHQDFVMVYGFSDDLEQRIKGFKDRGYVVQFMTGIAWGDYQDYLYGDFDGINHVDDAQMDAQGHYIIHGTSEDVPYMVPTHAFINYIYEKLKVVVDFGATAIHLEEPEFWSHGGYSKSFRDAYETYYHEPWSNPKEDHIVMYKSQMLKAYLYKRALHEIAERIKIYAKQTYDKYIEVYVPTHSLLNYSQWKIMSPESQLLDLKSIDGFIAQIWTGTSREPNVYKGLKKERTFETALLEYSMMASFSYQGKRMWFLHDPIEDNPSYTWENYRYNYEKTLIASLLSTTINDYEICPWPTRVFNRKLPLNDPNQRFIPKEYDAYLNQILNMLGDMPINNHNENDTLRISMLMSDTAMYQREDVHDDLTFSMFYGLALPLVKEGIFVNFLTIERLLVDYNAHHLSDILIMSYDFLKPINPSFHYVLLRWLGLGKTIIFVGDHSDTYHDVYPIFGFDKHPFLHLLEVLNVPNKEGIHQVNQGLFVYFKVNPKAIAYDTIHVETYLKLISKIYQKMGHTHKPKNYFHVTRGAYEIISVMDESISTTPFRKKGLYANLTSLTFDITDEIYVNVDEMGIFYNLALANHGDIIASTFRIYDIEIEPNLIRLSIDGRKHLKGHIRLCVKRKPVDVSEHFMYDERSQTILISTTLNAKKTITITL